MVRKQTSICSCGWPMRKPEQCFTWDSVPCTLQTTVLSFPLFLWNTGLAFTSLKDQLTWNQKSALFILPQSRARNQNLLLVLALFWPIMYVLCRFNISLPCRSMMSTSTCTNNSSSLASTRYVSTTVVGVSHTIIQQCTDVLLLYDLAHFSQV